MDNFNFLSFSNPTHKIKTKNANRSETVNNKTPRLSQPYFGQVWGEAQHLEKVRIWNPPGLPNV
jgi:hypothetical protein